MTKERAMIGTSAAVRWLALVSALIWLGGCDAPSTKTETVQPTQARAVVTPEMVGQANDALARGRASEARDLFQRILVIEPKHVEAQLGLGEAYLALGDIGNAQKSFAAVAEEPSVRAQALQGKGLAELAQKQVEGAMVDLSAAVAANPKLWRAWNGLGLLHDMKREWAEARAAFDKALGDAPATGLVHNNIGFSLMLQKRYAAAADEFRAALRQSPKLEAAQNNLRLALAFQGRYNEALDAIPKESRPSALNNVGYVAMLRQDYSAAEGYFSRAIEESPSYYETAAQNLARLKALEGQAPSASPPPKAKAE